MEGGEGGHMSHPIDYVDFTGNDLIELVDNLFNGKVEHMKEKLDGMNIFATMNNDGEVVFIRNKSNLNSERGGMSLEEMAEKWAEKERQKKVFLSAGKLITEIFSKLDRKYFNPDSETRKIINCECIISGKTNIMPYATDRVAFHGYKIYKFNGSKWIEDEDVEGHVEDIYDAAKDFDVAKPRPDLIIKSISDASKFAKKFIESIKKLFDDEGLTLENTIDEFKHTRFKKYAPEWMKDDDTIYNRLYNNDKSVNLTKIKKQHPDNIEEINNLDVIKKKIDEYVIGPLDNIFLAIGNEFINMLSGFTNEQIHDKVISTLKKDIEETIDTVKKSNSLDIQNKVEKQLERLKALGDKYNSAEGIVFMHKGRRMKLTGSFAPINQILGTRFKLEDK